MERFETIKIDKRQIVQKDGMEISAFIAGVNSGAYGLPYVISIRTWARKWFFKKFFYSEAKLNISEVIKLRDECNKVIQWSESKNLKNINHGK